MTECPPDSFGADEISVAMAESAAMPEKLKRCVEALEFIAFNNHPCWKDKDRRERALKTLLAIGHVRRITPEEAAKSIVKHFGKSLAVLAD